MPSHHTYHKCLSRGPEEVLFLFRAIQNPTWLPYMFDFFSRKTTSILCRNVLLKPGPGVVWAEKTFRLFIILTTVISRRKNQWYIVSQLLLEQNIWQAWSLVFFHTKLSVLLKIIFFHQSKNYKNQFKNSNFCGMWPLGHVGHVTYSFINMLFVSMEIFVYHSINKHNTLSDLMMSSAHKFCRYVLPQMPI